MLAAAVVDTHDDAALPEVPVAAETADEKAARHSMPDLAAALIPMVNWMCLMPWGSERATSSSAINLQVQYKLGVLDSKSHVTNAWEGQTEQGGEKREMGGGKKGGFVSCNKAKETHAGGSGEPNR